MTEQFGRPDVVVGAPSHGPAGSARTGQRRMNRPEGVVVIAAVLGAAARTGRCASYRRRSRAAAAAAAAAARSSANAVDVVIVIALVVVDALVMAALVIGGADGADARGCGRWEIEMIISTECINHGRSNLDRSRNRKPKQNRVTVHKVRRDGAANSPGAKRVR